MSRRNVRQTRRVDEAGFLPTQLAGLAFWVRSDLGITLVSSAVAAWADQSGNGNNVAQGTSAKQPTYNTSDASYGGRPSLSFSNSNSSSLLSSTSIVTAAQPITIVVVGEGSQAVGAQWFLTVGPGGGQNCGLEDPGTSAAGMIGLYGGSFAFVPATDSAAVYATVLKGASSALYRNNSQTAVGTGNPGTGALSNNVYVGSNSAQGQSLQGKICEALIYTRDLTTDGSLGTLFRYLGSTYGLPTS